MWEPWEIDSGVLLIPVTYGRYYLHTLLVYLWQDPLNQWGAYTVTHLAPSLIRLWL